MRYRGLKRLAAGVTLTCDERDLCVVELGRSANMSVHYDQRRIDLARLTVYLREAVHERRVTDVERISGRPQRQASRGICTRGCGERGD
jgi:hypothetical protein